MVTGTARREVDAGTLKHSTHQLYYCVHLSQEFLFEQLSQLLTAALEDDEQARKGTIR